MDTNSSDDSSSSSTAYSTESSSDDDGMEMAEINGQKLQLPQGLCEHKEIFLNLLSSHTWNQLSDVNRQHLQKFLPQFPENDQMEKNRTLEKLFNGEIFKFHNPLQKFHHDLKAGFYRPDIANMRRIIKKAEHKESQLRYRKYREKLKYDVIESQNRLMEEIINLPPGLEPKVARRKFCPEIGHLVQRTKRRYFQILTSIHNKIHQTNEDSYDSPDETYPEGPPPPLSRKQRRHLNSIKNHHHSSDLFQSTMSKSTNRPPDLDKYVTQLRNPFYITDDTYRYLIQQHDGVKRRKLDQDRPEYNTKGITLTDIVNRTQLPYIKNFTGVKCNDNATLNKPSKKRTARKEPSSNTEDTDSEIEAANNTSTPTVKGKVKTNRNLSTIKLPPPPPPPPPTGDISPIRPFELDMMEIPIELSNNSDIDVMDDVIVNNKPELMQETHSNFLSLIRDVICSTSEHRMNYLTLESRLKSWQENPITPLNDWYSQIDNWVVILKSAVDFLCGNFPEQPDDFVPYMEYKPTMDQYQWIGAGRDSDALLLTLCRYWLDHRCGDSKSAVKDEGDVEVTDRSQTPPPPRYPTNWIVRKATVNEIATFREQERRRYDNPHKAFTYRCHGYESVVGPLKGIYNPAVGSTNKARGHTMLNADRPNFVTILSLVRDATARLPNGEGTRADICELLKSSQYISSTAPDNVLQSVVSGALDRMHTQFDPCVKYDPKRKIWIYLHRNRSEDDFERIHQQYQVVNNKTKKTNSKKTKNPKTSKVATKVVKNDPKTNSLLISNQIDDDTNEVNLIHNKPVAKSLVKIISPNKQQKVTSTHRATPPPLPQKQLTVTTQQLLHSIQQQQAKQKNHEDKTTFNIQSITPQQLQSIKNVTLVRGIDASKGDAIGFQHHLIQAALKHNKASQQSTPASPQQQQVVLKQKVVALPNKVQPTQKIEEATTMKQSIVGAQNPVVAKVLTNAAGQVISVESLLAHQKQHGSLPQGTTLRVSGTKAGVLQITGATTKQNAIAQFASVSATSSPSNNIIITNQPKLVVASTPPLTTTQTTPSFVTSSTTLTKPTVMMTRTINKIQQQPKQLLNAKLMTTNQQNVVEQAKVVQPKLFMSHHHNQTNQIKLATAPKGMTLTNANTLRMVNAANLNLTHIGGKPVLLASKGTTIQNYQGQNVIIQTQPTTSGLVLQNTVKAATQQPNVMLGPHLKVPQQVVFNSGTTSKTVSVTSHQGHLVLEGHQVRVHNSTASGAQRLVLASQGQGGQIVTQQILLPAGFQGTAINIKALQGVKVIPLAQAQGRGRQVIARVMSPSVIKTSAAPPTTTVSTLEKSATSSAEPTITTSE